MGQETGTFRQWAFIKRCFYPNCNFEPIGAHTVSESKHLLLISDKYRKVFSTERSKWKCAKDPRLDKLYKLGIDKEIIERGYIIAENQFSQPQYIDISEASSVKIFCDTHDKFFLSFENNSFDKSNIEHLFLHAYRSHAREYYRKLDDYKNLLSIAHKIHIDYEKLVMAKYPVDDMLRKINEITSSTLFGLKELSDTKNHLNDILLKKEYSKLHYKVFEFNGIYPICCSSSFSPEYSFLNKPLNDPYNPNALLEPLFFTVFPETNGKTYILFSCFEVSVKSKIFLDDLPEDKEIIKNISSSLVITYAANAFFSTSYWSSLSSDERKIFRKELIMTLSEEARVDNEKFLLCESNFFRNKIN